MLLVLVPIIQALRQAVLALAQVAALFPGAAQREAALDSFNCHAGGGDNRRRREAAGSHR
jgi:hypothetical protein